jgi:hypothetical protein
VLLRYTAEHWLRDKVFSIVNAFEQITTHSCMRFGDVCDLFDQVNAVSRYHEFDRVIGCPSEVGAGFPGSLLQTNMLSMCNFDALLSHSSL